MTHNNVLCCSQCRMKNNVSYNGSHYHIYCTRNRVRINTSPLATHVVANNETHAKVVKSNRDLMTIIWSHHPYSEQNDGAMI